MRRLTILFFVVIFLSRCNRVSNPDDGIRLKVDLKVVTVHQLLHNNYVEFIKGSGTYDKVIGDTTIVYGFGPKDIERHAIFKYNEDTTIVGYKKFFQNRQFEIVRTFPGDYSMSFFVKDKKYNKFYTVSLSNQRALEFLSK